MTSKEAIDSFKGEKVQHKPCISFTERNIKTFWKDLLQFSLIKMRKLSQLSVLAYFFAIIFSERDCVW